MLQLKTKRKLSKIERKVPNNSLIVECPSCNAIITVKNANKVNNRFCWRCFETVTFKH